MAPSRPGPEWGISSFFSCVLRQQCYSVSDRWWLIRKWVLIWLVSCPCIDRKNSPGRLVYCMLHPPYVRGLMGENWGSFWVICLVRRLGTARCAKRWDKLGARCDFFLKKNVRVIFFFCDELLVCSYTAVDRSVFAWLMLMCFKRKALLFVLRGKRCWLQTNTAREFGGGGGAVARSFQTFS